MTTSEHPLRDLLVELAGTKCFCGATKLARRSFCINDYWALPHSLRQRLYLKIGHGYETAYADAREFLAGRKPE